MNHERRQMIVKEIEYWRRSRLLPDQYCDFLLNLYADPDDPSYAKKSDAPTHAVGKAIAAVQNATGKQWLLTFGTFTLISFVVLYFSRFHPALQIGVVAGSAAALLWIGKRIRERNEAIGLSATGLGMLILLGGGLHLLELHQLTDWGWKAALIAFSALFWIVYGILARIPILHLCGWFTGLLMYGWLLSRFTSDPAWYEVQLYWLPLAILFGWSSWFFHRWTKPVSAILFLTCAVAWFMPELYSIVILKETSWLQLQLLTKIAFGGALLFSMRKQWMVWVA
ncbi:hypothetical protein D3P08_07810 [Paenibacillus nanensis]|uniref:DUF2157 domain-containing protein n=1 Tax=Paenibacillus nanensis TaxID=393251 RepID=A0A3A1V064_9BACL|nr:hypothetical protein [Paenibacillus nanensis]RIX54138.1 hypothetical protein D3P08_07810 [Paenibacillus nanensis]